MGLFKRGKKSVPTEKPVPSRDAALTERVQKATKETAAEREQR